VKPKTALIYSQALSRYSYGDEHPFKPERYRLAFELMTAFGLTAPPFETVTEFPLLSEADLLSFHAPEYLARLREFSASSQQRADFRFGLGDVENPIFPGVFDCALLGASGTSAAAGMILEKGYRTVFHLAGGWHHAHRAKASGFSYLNDAVLAIHKLLDKGVRVAYLDIDAHHGDGVQEAFYESDRVLTISLHQSGTYFFPGTGFQNETGSGAGAGFSVNVPFLEQTDDELFIKAFDEVALPLLTAFAPDVLVTQLGADTFCSDPLSLLEVTTRGYCHAVRSLRALDLPWLALAGGGYDNFNVARAWTLAWSIMNDVELAPTLPEAFDLPGAPHRMLLDPVQKGREYGAGPAREALESCLAYLKRTVFPLHAGRL
jgi:acetoin utilization protein AcuC